MRAGNLEAVIRRLEPKDAAAYTGRGGAHYLKGEFKEAVEDYNKVIEMQPKEARPLAQRGYALAPQSFIALCGSGPSSPRRVP